MSVQIIPATKSKSKERCLPTTVASPADNFKIRWIFSCFHSLRPFFIHFVRFPGKIYILWLKNISGLTFLMQITLTCFVVADVFCKNTSKDVSKRGNKKTRTKCNSPYVHRIVIVRHRDKFIRSRSPCVSHQQFIT